MPTSQRQIERLTAAIERLATAIENAARAGLGETPEPGYPVCSTEHGLVSEAVMAQMLGIPHRTLGKHRRKGRFPSCWHKNGRRVYWQVAETLETWKRGIA